MEPIYSIRNALLDATLFVEFALSAYDNRDYITGMENEQKARELLEKVYGQTKNR